AYPAVVVATRFLAHGGELRLELGHPASERFEIRRNRGAVGLCGVVAIGHVWDRPYAGSGRVGTIGRLVKLVVARSATPSCPSRSPVRPTCCVPDRTASST